jgi:uncharacterized membrane protein
MDENPQNDLPSPPSAKEARLAALAHGSVLLVFFLPLGNVAGPGLLFWLAGKRSPFVANHAGQAVVYQALVCLISWSLYFLAFLYGWRQDAHFIALLVSLAPHLPAAFFAWRGSPFRFPLLAAWVEGRIGVWGTGDRESGIGNRG